MGNATRHISPARKSVPGKTNDLTVIIPCAGIGRRMKRGEPKSLIEFNGESLISRQIRFVWNAYPKADIMVVGGYHISKLRKHLAPHAVRLIYNPIYDDTNVLFSILLALQASISKHVMVVYGDLMVESNAIPDTFTVGKSKILVDAHNCFSEEEVGVVVSGKHITSLSFGLTTKWAQIAYLTGTELELFKEICYNEDTARWFGYEGLNEVINKNGRFEAVNSNGRIIEIDQQEDLQKAANLA